MKEVLKNYSGIILLLLGIAIGSIIGVTAPGIVDYIKPLGDIFLNLLFVSVVPLVFFAVSNSIASLEQGSKFGENHFSDVLYFSVFHFNGSRFYDLCGVCISRFRSFRQF
ncbi:C4-dicarboxylate transporter DctA [Chryseobacterium carnipullorum]|uniref:C4-dicarboxylate transporter DctA n=1 Tax=Chryseobacterium carnipullorum TaxID=1124835 RepID=A0A376DQM9_CHRCU|nr:C4-dicarboxylate transporter DctA [Chryseobacterium carnipullorum]